MKRSEALTKFLSTCPSELARMYTREMEVQVSVDQMDGRKEQRTYNDYKYSVYTNGVDEWKDFRIPINANSTPVDNDYNQNYPIAKYVLGIGMTGWNWVKTESCWFGFDFDSIVNHAGGISEEELGEVKTRLEEIEWVDIYSSTSGKGIHAYVHLETPIKTDTHTEHAALARSILSLMSAEVGFNFAGSIDCFGGVMWVYHKKGEGTTGLTNLKRASKRLSASRIPRNWREHVSVVSGKRKRIKSTGGNDGLAQAVQDIRLDAQHRMILNWLARKAERTFWWDGDNHMFVGHTKDLETCHQELKLRGLFATNSGGGDDKQNCFAFPVRGGRFSVRRYAGASEHKAWSTDEKGWTKIMFNAPATFRETCLYLGALENDKGDFIFQRNASMEPPYLRVAKTLEVLGVDFPPSRFSVQLHSRDILLKHTENRITIRVGMSKEDMLEEGWIKETKYWLNVCQYSEGDSIDDVEDIDLDSYIRYCVKDGNEAGVFIRVDDQWIGQTQSNVDAVLGFLMSDRKATERLAIKGRAVLKPWYLENIPFDEEYPGGRVWNKDAAQLAFTPEKGVCPTWWKILEHIGESITPVVLQNVWCVRNGILTGAEYLMTWISYMFQKPEQQLPYLFLTSYAQNSGKSTLQEMLSLLFMKGRGYARAENALKDNYNAELAGAILTVIEEVDLGSNMTAYNRMKDFITAQTIAINTKYKSVYMAKNYTHWIHTANNPHYCPIFEGDTRVVVIEVNPIAPSDEIDKHRLKDMVAEEAPAFLYEVMNRQLPTAVGRLAIPVLETELKGTIQEANQTVLEEFFRARVSVKLGHRISLVDFTTRFINALKSKGFVEEAGRWTERRVKAQFPKRIPIYIGRIESDFNEGVSGNYNEGGSGAERGTERGTENEKEWICNVSLDHDVCDRDFMYDLVKGVIIKTDNKEKR